METGTEISSLREILKTQELVSDVSAILEDCPSENVDERIQSMLQRVVEFLEIDRSSFAEFSEDLGGIHITHSYAVPGIEPFPQANVTKSLPWLFQKTRAGEMIAVDDISGLPPEASIEKAYLEGAGIKSQLTIPFSVGGKMLCVIGFASFRISRTWPQSLRDQLKRMGEIIAHAIYRKRAEEKIRSQYSELEARARFEQLIADISADLVNIATDEVDRKIEESLEELVLFFRIDRLALLKVSDGGRAATVTHSANAEGIRPAPVNINYADYFPWHAKRLLAGEIVNIDVKDLPPEADIDRSSAAGMEIQSILVIPLKVSGSLAHVLVANTVRSERMWEVEFVPRIRLLGESFVDALTRKDAEERIHDQLTFERLVSDISASFVNAPPEHVDPAIEMGLNRLLEFFDLDHCSLISIGTDARTAAVTHAAHTEGVVAPPAQIDFAHDFPWLSSRLFARETVWASVDELPAEAEIDRKTAIQLGIKSFLLVPLRVDGFVSHVLAATSLRSTGAWPDTVISRIRLLAEIFTSAVARKRAQAQLVQSYAQIQELKNRLEAEAEYLRSEIQVAYHYEDIIGESRPILEVLAQVEQVAPTGSSVLILGETGTGKELVARAIHNLSPRRARAMVKVNCASLPSTLIESELFGREKGAYTGALTRQMGRFELADESTLFLDEIGELSQELQTKLLRVLQEGEFERLGSPRTIKVNVRVIAATNRNLLQAVQKGSFRQDLYYRLNVFPIRVPTLRERPKDIPLLISAFLNEFGLKMSKKIDVIPKPTMDALIRYPWPGNIRELRNVIEHAVIISNGNRLTVQLPEDPTVRTGGRLTLEDVERKHILDTLESTGWVIKGSRGAATVLRLKPSTLYNKMKKLEIVRPEKP